MPTLLRWKGSRFFFYSADGWEPAHVRVVKGDREANLWLGDLSVAVTAKLGPLALIYGDAPVNS